MKTKAKHSRCVLRSGEGLFLRNLKNSHLTITNLQVCITSENNLRMSRALGPLSPGLPGGEGGLPVRRGVQGTQTPAPGRDCAATPTGWAESSQGPWLTGLGPG